jgi:hypothetical protein
MNVFFELAENAVLAKIFELPGQYFAYYNVPKNETIIRKYNTLARCSDRIWAEEDNGHVRFLKNRYSIAYTTEVDMKEFFWVKLRSISL